MNQIIKIIERLVEEAPQNAPSIANYSRDGNYGNVNDEKLNFDWFIKWKGESRAILAKLAETGIPIFKELCLEFQKLLESSKKYHSKSIFVHMNLEILINALSYLRTSREGSLIDSIPSNSMNENMDKIDIFISHCSRDLDVVQSLIDLIRTSLNLNAEQIRCTSVEGYLLPGGADTDEQLRNEIFSSKVFIGIITPESLNSAFVLFELGARWGNKKPIIPVLAKGVVPKILQGPLQRINCLNCNSTAQIHQLIEQLSTELNINKQSAPSFQGKIELLSSISVKYSNRKENPEVEGELVFDDGVYWIDAGGKKEGPFCQVCKDIDNKFVRLVNETVDIGEDLPEITRYCRNCGRHQ